MIEQNEHIRPDSDLAGDEIQETTHTNPNNHAPSEEGIDESNTIDEKLSTPVVDTTEEWLEEKSASASVKGIEHDTTEQPLDENEDEETDSKTIPAHGNESLFSLSAPDLFSYLDKEIQAERLPDMALINRLKNLVEKDQTSNTSDKDILDSSIDSAKGIETESESIDGHPQETVNDEELISESTEIQIAFINLKTRYQQLKNELKERDKKEREDNLQLKEELLLKLEETLNAPGDFFKIRNERNNIVARWREIGAVPDNKRTALLDRYSKLNEQFYHQNKLEKEAMEEDYRHNKKEKEGFIARAKELADEPDIEKAFRELQYLHDQWKEVGPVAPEYHQAMWAEFKEASTTVNRRFDQHHQELHKQYEENFDKKKTLIEQLENMLVELPQTREGWRKYEVRMGEIHSEWKHTGRVPKEKTADINGRFRQAMDEFYLQRRTFMKDLSAEIAPKLEKMRALVAEADSLKESTDWRVTSDKMLEIQKQWKEISNLGANVGEANRLWRRLRQSMDYFFGKKRETAKTAHASRDENLTKKRAIAERLKALWEEKPSDLETQVSALQTEWDSIGAMPDAKKEEVMNLYYGTLREIRGESRYRGRKGEGNRGDKHEKRDNRKDRRREDSRQGSDRASRYNAGIEYSSSQPRRSTLVDTKKDLSTLDTKELQEERKVVKRAIQDQNEELRKLETNLGFFSGSTDNPMFAHVRQQMDLINERLSRYEYYLTEIKKSIKNGSSSSTELTDQPLDNDTETSHDVNDNNSVTNSSINGETTLESTEA